MHAVAFPAPSVSVIHPAPHTAHATVDALLYCPAAQAVQVLAPTAACVLVIDPVSQTSHALVDRVLY